MGRTAKEFKFAIGDRVARRPKVDINVARRAAMGAFRAGSKEVHGTVVGLVKKKNFRSGAVRKFIQVKWDGRSSVISEHEQMRLCFASELSAESNAARLHHE